MRQIPIGSYSIYCSEIDLWVIFPIDWCPLWSPGQGGGPEVGPGWTGCMSLYLLSSTPIWQVGQHVFSLRNAEAKVQQVFGRPSPVPFGRAKSFFPASAVLRGNPETQGSSAERFKWQFRAADVLELRFPAQTLTLLVWTHPKNTQKSPGRFQLSFHSWGYKNRKWLKPPSYDGYIHYCNSSCHGSSTQQGQTFNVAAPSAGRTQFWRRRRQFWHECVWKCGIPSWLQ